MLLMVEKGITGGVSHATHRYAKANNKYMKNYDKEMKSSYLEYLDASKLSGGEMFQKLPVNGFEWVEELSQFNEDIIKILMKTVMRDIFLKQMLNRKKFFSFHNDLPFLPERNKIKKCNKLVCNVHDKENYVVHIRALKQALNHGQILKKVHRVIEFDQEAWIKPYIDINTKLRIEVKNDFEKDFFKPMNHAGFGKAMENVRKNRDTKLVTTDKRRNQLASEPDHHTTKDISENLMAIEMKKTKVKINKLIYLGMSILDISKT